MAAKYGSRFRITAAPSAMATHLLGAAVLVLMLVWILHFRGGLSLVSHDSERLLNAHPVLMLMGLILCGGEALIAYKVIPRRRKLQKLAHMSLHLGALLKGALGLHAAFKSRRLKGKPDLYSLHSRIGLGAICLYAAQWLLGFFSFWWPRAGKSTQANLVPWHWFAGAGIFLMAVCAAEMGLVERSNSLGLVRGEESLVVSLTAAATLFFAGAVVLTVILPRHRTGIALWALLRTKWPLLRVRPSDGHSQQPPRRRHPSWSGILSAGDVTMQALEAFSDQ